MHEESVKERVGFRMSTDLAEIDLDSAERFLRGTYWAADRSRARIELSLRHSVCFAILDVERGRLAAFARVVSDFANFAWLCDVVVDEPYRGRGLGIWLVEAALAHPELAPVPRWILATTNAHELYARFGFDPLAHPERWMERLGAGPQK